MISTNEFKTNVTVTIDGDAWQVVEFQHVKPGKGAAFVRAKCVTCAPVLLLSVPSTQASVCRRLTSTVAKCNICMNPTACMYSWTMKPTNKPS